MTYSQIMMKISSSGTVDELKKLEPLIRNHPGGPELNSIMRSYGMRLSLLQSQSK